jgi:histone deacetylase complex regulatory component SIN3
MFTLGIFKYSRNECSFLQIVKTYQKDLEQVLAMTTAGMRVFREIPDQQSTFCRLRPDSLHDQDHLPVTNPAGTVRTPVLLSQVK